MYSKRIRTYQIWWWYNTLSKGHDDDNVLELKIQPSDFIAMMNFARYAQKSESVLWKGATLMGARITFRLKTQNVFILFITAYFYVMIHGTRLTCVCLVCVLAECTFAFGYGCCCTRAVSLWMVNLRLIASFRAQSIWRVTIYTETSKMGTQLQQCRYV